MTGHSRPEADNSQTPIGQASALPGDVTGGGGGAHSQGEVARVTLGLL